MHSYALRRQADVCGRLVSEIRGEAVGAWMNRRVEKVNTDADWMKCERNRVIGEDIPKSRR